MRAWTLGNAVFAVADLASGEVLGSVTLRDVHRIPDQALAAYWVTPAARGRRVGARALDAASRWGFTRRPRTAPDLARPRAGQRRLLPRCLGAGFQLEGVMRDYYVEPSGRRHDSHLHARLATDPGLQA